MNPIKNRRDLEAIINDIRNFAFSYLEKYSPSKQQLRIYLFKKFLKENQKIYNKKELFNLIDTVVATLVDEKLLNDENLKKKYSYWVKNYNKLKKRETINNKQRVEKIKVVYFD